MGRGDQDTFGGNCKGTAIESLGGGENSFYWAYENGIKLIGGLPFSVEGYGYQYDILTDPSVEKAIMKCAQSGVTTLFMLDAIHGLIFRKYPQGVIYYFPTQKAVEGFSKTRFGPLVDDNPAIRRHMQATNSVSIKKVGETFLSLLGCSSTQTIGMQKKDGTSVRQTPADYVIRDERDLFDESMVRMTKDRLQNSKISKEVDLGTPTIPDYGIHKIYMESDQRKWFVPCRHCNTETCLVEEFPNCVKYKDGQAHFVCKECGHQIYPAFGRWVAKYPEREVAGWHISHLITPNCKLNKIMARWEHDQREGKIGEFYNGVLGLPYIPAEDRLRQSDVLACCGHEAMRTWVSGTETAMGVDVGKHYHTVVIAEKIDKTRAKIIYLARVKGFGAVLEIARKYNVKSGVVDCRPYEEEAETFQQNCGFRCFLAEYRDKQSSFVRTDEKAGRYSLLRNQIFDKSHAWIVNKQVELPHRCSEVDEYARQMCNAAKVLEENEQGDRVYRYIKLGDDHYRSATNYLILAMENLTHYQGLAAVGKMEKETPYDVLRWGL